ncbi:MAG: hypothetical protein OXB97_08210 [Rhodospirillales bacterium]|nr:hypothetical protein [Rhodospirillales bacterium]
MIAAPTLEAVKLALRLDEGADVDDDAFLSRIIRSGTEHANRQAPDAPADTAHEAIIRFCGFMYEGPSATAGGNEAGIWRRCGAAGLLSPWTVRRAGAIR